MMKSLAVVLLVLVLVAAVAVTGSRAQPVPRTNPFLQICQQSGPIVPDSARCRPVALLADPGALDKDVGLERADGGDWSKDGGRDYADGDWWVEVVKAVWEVAWRAGVVAAAAELVTRAMDRAFDGYTGEDYALAPLDTAIFDPKE